MKKLINLKIKKPLIIQSNTIFGTFKAFTPGQLSFIQSHNVDLLCVCTFDERAPIFFQREGVRYFFVEMKREISPINDIKALVKILRLLNIEKPLLVQGATPKAGFLFMIAAFLTNVPARIFFMRGIRSSGLNGFKKFVVKKMEQLTCLAAHKVLCTSKSVMYEALSQRICSKKKIAVLANGTGNGIDSNFFNKSFYNEIDIKKFRESLSIPDETRVVLYVGRIAKDKGIMELNAAWKILGAKHRNLILLIVGKIDETDSPPDYIIRELNENKTVKIVGYSNDVRPYYAIADIFVLPTYREGIPISLLEASSMELPVIASRVTGCVDALIENKTGKFINAKSPEALAEAIEKYLDNPDLRLLHGINGRKFVEKNFHQKIVWNALINEYEKLIFKKCGLKIRRKQLFHGN